MLKKKFLDKMKNTLIEQKNLLLKKTYSNDIDFDGDETDEIQANLIAAMNKKLSSRDGEKINKIDLALQRIEENKYGQCTDCEEDIPEKRLEINPYFTLCVDCSEDRELEAIRQRLL